MAQAPRWQSYDDIQNDEVDIKSSIIDWFESVAVALTFMIVVFVFCVRIVMVSGISMRNTLNDNDRVVVQSFFYTPQQGDVVVIDSYTKFGKPLVKRIIAIEGDTISINGDTKEVIVNNIVLNEAYISTQTNVEDTTKFPITIPHGFVFVMGDNRANSLDSRSNDIGVIDERDILGKVIFRFYPFSNIGVING